ncbi:UvrD-helicase domain-containing protein [Syntrophobotulus glycolicus]|nr:ATP-dependent helicase [Syntrophobotulus glycolicus]
MNEDLELLLDKLNEQQKTIVMSNDNILVTACPGSGKTRVLTYKLAYTALSNPHSNRKIIAITYTNRAADEIKDRLELLDIDQSAIWAGTIHQFCLEYIIYPYAMSLPRLCKGFTIIDEYVHDQYIQQILDKFSINIPSYQKSKIITMLNNDMEIIETQFPQVVKGYHDLLIQNKEIDFDLILSLSYQILRNHPIASVNIAGIIRSVCVDEYQDTNELQYQIIGILTKTNNRIKVMFVGDTDQAIYTSLGGIAKSIKEIEEITALRFTRETLNGCYRSTQRVIDYYSYFQKESYKIISLATHAELKGIIYLNTSIHKDDIYDCIAELIRHKIDQNVLPEEICVIAPQWFLLYPLSRKLRELLPDISFDAPDISPIKADDMNVFYKLARLIFTEPGKKVPRRKRIATEIIKVLSEEYNILLNEHIDCFWILQKINSIHPNAGNGVDYYKHVIEELFSSCGINREDNSSLYSLYDNFIGKTEERIKRHSLSDDLSAFYKMFREKTGVVITTCHKIKGEEYNTVIAFGIFYGMIPHWDSIFSPVISEVNEAKKMLYVIASRAKESLYLFAEQGRTTSNGAVYALTDILKTYSYDYDT